MKIEITTTILKTVILVTEITTTHKTHNQWDDWNHNHSESPESIWRMKLQTLKQSNINMMMGIQTT